MEKKRLDLLAVERGLAESRERAKALILAGEIYVDNERAGKPKDLVPESAVLEHRGGGLRYVSRGGLKLEKALAVFPIALRDRVCLDVGASTGGFTDCMLQNGGKKVYAVDVGYGQLARSLREDSRVVNLERVNARYLSRELVPEPVDFFSVDVSFISLTLILPAIHGLLGEKGQGVCLIKPQFEAGREKVGKKGVVRDLAVHAGVMEKIETFALETGFSVLGLDYSPIKGPEGNIEYLICLGKSPAAEMSESVPSPGEVAAASHAELDK